MRQVEVERKFDIGADATIPSLEGLARMGSSREHRMRAVYVDTRDLVLARHRITLRRREGGNDAGWHLKLPLLDGARLEVHAPLVGGPGCMRVPEVLRAEVVGALEQAWRGGVESTLLPAAVLTTVRIETDLLRADGGLSDDVLAQLCDDTVGAQPCALTWRELEVELVADHADGQGLLTAIVEAFADQGVTVSDSPSKLARALGDRPARAERGEVPPLDGPAADVLHAYLAEQVAGIIGREDEVRVDAPDAVHKTRVATRRLRSALRSFDRLFDREVTDPLRAEVRWLAAALGEPRDAEVMRDLIEGLLDDLAPEQLVGPVRVRVETELDRRHAEAHARLVQVMDSERYLALTDRLMELLADPPWREAARSGAVDVLPAMVTSAINRASAQWRAAQAAVGEEQLHLLHETRKRAKAVRYAAEALAPSFGEEVAQAAQTWEQVTESLGGLQDAVVASRWIADLAASAQAAGEPTFTYGVIVGEESVTGQFAMTESEVAIRAALAHPWP